MSNTRLHLCKLPRGTPRARHTCEGCHHAYRYRPVACRELGRVIYLWVKES